jgi:hypothetical protein
LSLFKHFVCILVLFPLAAVGGVIAAATGRVGAGKDDRLQEAEKIADLVVERFHETLDFAPVFEEFFVREPALRKRAMLSNGYSEISKLVTVPIGDGLLQDFFVTDQTALHLVFEYRLAHPDGDLPAGADVGGPYLNCPRGSKDRDQRRFVQALRACIQQTKQKSKLFVPHLGKEVFAGAAFKAAVTEYESQKREEEQGRKLAAVPRVEGGSQLFGISDSIPVYIIRKEVRDYYFVEEDHTFRLFYVDYLPNFTMRLF